MKCRVTGTLFPRPPEGRLAAGAELRRLGVLFRGRYWLPVRPTVLEMRGCGEVVQSSGGNGLFRQEMPRRLHGGS